MKWIFLAIVFIIFSLLLFKGLIIKNYRWGILIKEHKVPYWVLLLIFIFYCIPIIGITVFICVLIYVFGIPFIKEDNGEYYQEIVLSDTNILHKVIKAIKNFLIREL